MSENAKQTTVPATNPRRSSDQLRAIVTQRKLPEPPLSKSVIKMITESLNVIPGVLITPETAKELIKLNTANRPIAKPTLGRYANDMKAGRWIFSGNTLKFDKNIVLRDGQHSLLAVIESETTQMFNIQTGLDPASFTVMDINKMRSAGDTLAIKGFDNYNVYASAIKTIIFYEQTGRLRSNIHADKIGNKEVDRWSDKKREMSVLISQLTEIHNLTSKRARFLAQSTWLFLFYVLSKRDADQAHEFLTKLASGENISMQKNAPIYLLRETLISFGKNDLGVIKAGGSAAIELKIRYVFRAWNAWRSKEVLSKLKIKPSDAKLEELI